VEYFLGSILTFAIILVANRVLREPIKKFKTKEIKYTQSHVYSLVAPLLQFVPEDNKMPPTQATKFIENSYIRVVVLERSAYWIKDNALYTADIIEGAVDRSTTKRVDTMTMDKVQLDQTLFIVEKLREGLDNDFGGTGKQ
jgi:hypothetical protein